METEPAIIPENPWVASSRRGLPRTFQELKGLGSHDKVLPKRSQSRNLCLSSWPGDSQENAAPFFLPHLFGPNRLEVVGCGKTRIFSRHLERQPFSKKLQMFFFSEGALGWYIFIYFEGSKMLQSYRTVQHLGFCLLGRIHLPLPGVGDAAVAAEVTPEVRGKKHEEF